MTSKYKSVLSEKSIPVDMIDFLLAGDDEGTENKHRFIRKSYE